VRLVLSTEKKKGAPEAICQGGKAETAMTDKRRKRKGKQEKWQDRWGTLKITS